MQRRKTSPAHKALQGVAYGCSCGWSGAIHFGRGRQYQAAAEWRSHREKCEAAAEIEAQQKIDSAIYR